jgi:hypothetical protein
LDFPDYSVLKIDFKNAFNNISRAAVMLLVAKHVPAIYHWVNFTLANPSRLTLGDNSYIFSKEGVQQGDPLGPVLFALAISPLTRQLAPIPNLMLNKWYLDDGALGGSESVLTAAFRIIEKEGPALGLFVNAKKCELVRHSSASEVTYAGPPGVPVIIDNWSILGSPIGDAAHCRAFVEQAVLRKVEESANLCVLLEDPQLSFSLLRKCVSFCQGVYISRSCPPSCIEVTLASCDQTVKNAFEKIACFFPTPSQWQQATLSTSRGGLGLRSSATHAPAAYFASAKACAEEDEWDPHSAEDFDYAVSRIRSLTNRPHWGMDGEFQGSSQHDLSGAIDDRQLELLLSVSTELDRARLLSCSAQGIASAWINAAPSAYLGNAFTPACFNTALKLWLGAPVCSAAPCPQCDTPMDTNGYHALTCKKNHTWTRRHDSLRDIFFDFCQMGRLHPKKEPPIPTLQRDHKIGAVRETNTRSDILILTGARPRAVDFAVTSPLQPLYLTGAAKETGYAAERYAVDIKEKRYASEFAKQDIDFTPMVLETFGALCIKGRSLLGFVARSVASCRNVSVSTVTQRINAQLSCCLMRFNAHAIMERDPPPPMADQSV